MRILKVVLMLLEYYQIMHISYLSTLPPIFDRSPTRTGVSDTWKRRHVFSSFLFLFISSLSMVNFAKFTIDDNVYPPRGRTMDSPWLVTSVSISICESSWIRNIPIRFDFRDSLFSLSLLLFPSCALCL